MEQRHTPSPSQEGNGFLFTTNITHRLVIRIFRKKISNSLE